MKMTTARARVIGVLLSFPEGEILAANVVERSGLPSGTAYPILNALVEEGCLGALAPGFSRKTTYTLQVEERRSLQRAMDEFVLKTPGLTFAPAITPQEPRELVGRAVRQVWVKWAREQSDPKPSWLLPWEELDEGQREVDMRIGAALFDAGKKAGYEYGHVDAEVAQLEKRVTSAWHAKAQVYEQELEKYRHRFGPLSEDGL